MVRLQKKCEPSSTILGGLWTALISIAGETHTEGNLCNQGCRAHARHVHIRLPQQERPAFRYL